MEINNLLESANGYKALQADAARLAEKWSASGLLEGLGEKESSNMSIMLENQAKQIVAEQSGTGTGAIGNGTTASEQWAGVALPLVRKVFAQISSKDFVSVQPMNLPSGLVFYLDFKYGSADGAQNRLNGNMYGNVTEAGTKMARDVDASGGLYGAGQFGYSINHFTGSVASQATGSATSASLNYDADKNPANFRVVSVATSAIPGFDPEGVRAFRLLSQSVDITDNPELTVFNAAANTVDFVVSEAPGGDTLVTGFAATVNYHKQPADNSRGDFEDGKDQHISGSISIPEINVELKSEAVVAKTRKLKAQWTPEFAQDLNAYHSIDAEAELTSLLSEYISMEIDLEILDMLIAAARTTERWSAENNKFWTGTAWDTSNTSDFYNTQGQWFQTLGTKIQKVSNKIHQKTLRGGANFLVCSPSVATILESIPGYAANTDGDSAEFAFGVQRVGQLNGRYKVYKNPYVTENTILMGFRGGQFLESGAVYAPYVPLIMTPLVYDPNTFTPRKGIMTRYAKKMIRPEFYGKVFISDLELI